jgi:hypothetical protein
MQAWLAKYEAGGLENLGDGSHRPTSCPHQMSAEVEDLAHCGRLQRRPWSRHFTPNVAPERRRRAHRDPHRSASLACGKVGAVDLPCRVCLCSGLGHHLEHFGGDEPSGGAWRRSLTGSLGSRLGGVFIVIDDHAARAMTVAGPHPRAAHEPRTLHNHGNCDVVKELDGAIGFASSISSSTTSPYMAHPRCVGPKPSWSEISHHESRK